ncbi:MAG: rRNA methyltransferase [Sphingobacteriales bacterium]|nr:rRNA methyltransferase [Sphingobacteriales bacterium]
MKYIPELPGSFLNRMKRQLGDEFQAFKDSYGQPPTISVRLNPLKRVTSFDGFAPVPWNQYGRYLTERPDFVFDPLIHAGAYYVQEASSMLFAKAIDFSKDLMILDLCASPGGKSTLMLSEMTENSLLFSNEIVRKRSGVLYENIVKWGYPNVVVTSNSPEEYKTFTAAFDVVVVDAPCSGEGMFRKEPETIREWRENKPFQCLVTQKDILDQAIGLVRDNGLLVYMTCTFSLEENEQVVSWFLKKYKDRAQLQSIDFEKAWGVTEVKTENGSVYRCYPHKLKGEGMFIAVFTIRNANKPFFSKKNQESLKKINQDENKLLQDFVKLKGNLEAFRLEDKIMVFPGRYLSQIALAHKHLNVLKSGITAASVPYKKQNLIPTHELAMSKLHAENICKMELTQVQALAYLKKMEIKPQNFTELHSQWMLASYQGIALGWLKTFKNNLNNFYPKEWVIRKNLPENIYHELKKIF